jgi:hypothetical protein
VAEVSPGEAIAEARRETGVGEAVPARAWRVRRLDHPGRAYYLVILGDERTPGTVAAVDAATGAVSASAPIAARASPVAVDAADAAALAGGGQDTPAELVWGPSRATRSPLYPLWEVRTAAGVRYVDQQRAVWRDPGAAGPGG